MSQHMGEGKSPFEKEIPNQTNDYVSLKLFSSQGFLTLISIYGESHMNTYQGGRNQSRNESLGCFVILSFMIFKVVYISNKNYLSSFFLPLILLIFLRSCLLVVALNSAVPLRGLLQGLKSSLQGAQWQVSLLFEKKGNLLK